MIVKVKSDVSINVTIKEISLRAAVKKDIALTVLSNISLDAIPIIELESPVISALNVSFTENAISWTAVQFAVGYTLEKLINGVWTVVVNNQVVTAYNDTVTTPGAQESYRVKAIGDVATTSDSPYAIVNITTTPPVTLSAPVATLANVSLTANSISWLAIPNASSYRVEKLVGSDWQVLSANLNALTFQENDIFPGSVIQYRVRANGNNFSYLDSSYDTKTITTLDFHAKYRAVVNKAIALNYTLPIVADLLKENDFMITLVNNGVLAEMDAYYVFAKPSTSPNTKDFAGLNWVNPEVANCTYVGNVLQLGKEGLQTELENYIQTNYIFPSHAVKFTLNDAGVHYHQLNEFQTGSVAFGIEGTATNTRRVYAIPRAITTNATTMALNRAGAGATALSLTQAGFHQYMRFASNTTERSYINGVQKINRVAAPVGIPNQNIGMPIGAFRAFNGFSLTTPAMKWTMFAIGGSGISNVATIIRTSWTTYYATLT